MTLLIIQITEQGFKIPNEIDCPIKGVFLIDKTVFINDQSKKWWNYSDVVFGIPPNGRIEIEGFYGEKEN